MHPQSQSVLAPAVYAPPTGVVRTHSVVGAPTLAPTLAAPDVFLHPTETSVPAMPPRLTEGIPNVESILSQKAAYNKSLDDQLAQGVKVLNQQNKQRKDYLMQVANQQKTQFNLQVDQQLKAQEMALDQQYNHQLMTLQQAAHEQKSALEAQANTLSLEYQQKKAQEDFNFQQYDIQRQHYDAQTKLNQELGKLQQQERETVIPSVFGSHVPPPTGPLQSYTPPVFASRPSFSHTPVLVNSSSHVPMPTVISHAAPTVITQPTSTVVSQPITHTLAAPATTIIR